MSRGSIVLLISIFLLTPSLYYFISLKLNINPSFHFMFRPNMTNNLHNTNNTKPKTTTPPDWVPDHSLLTNWSNTAPILHCPREIGSRLVPSYAKDTKARSVVYQGK